MLLRFLRRLPSITTLLGLFGVTLLIPLMAIAAIQWQRAEERFDAAIEVQQRTERLDTLIRLLAAVDDETRSTIWTVGENSFLSDLPPDVAEFLDAGSGTSMSEEQGRVDQLLRAIDDPELAERLDDARERTMSGDLALSDSGVAFGAVVLDIESELENELTQLTEAAIAAGDDSTLRAASAAEAAAAVQVTVAGQHDAWSLLRSAEYVQPQATDVTNFMASVEEFRDSAVALDRAVDFDTQSGALWLDFRSDNDVASLFDTYDVLIESFVLDGLGTNTEIVEIDDSQLPDLLLLASDLNDAQSAADSVNDQVATVVDATLVELRSASGVVIDDAQGDRNRTVLWLAAAVVAVIAGVLALIALVGRPMRAMADAAEQLSVGQLNTHLTEHGPREVRHSARAINQALASLRNTEAQAVALAEERLDDPVLQERAVGGIGESVQTAVERLARSLGEREEFQQQLAHEAAHDGLTKLPNRTAVIKHLTAAIARTRRSSSSLAILYLDVDDFKLINDAHGHHAGDAVLRSVAKRLVRSIREGDLGGRLGGDEFVVVAEAVENVDEALELAHRVAAEVSRPVQFDGGEFEPTVSIGVAVADGDLTADELLRDADLAVYRAKSLGKGRIDVCDEDLRGEVRERETLEKALERALTNNEFILHFQPSVDAQSHTVTSFEALIRWHHPERGVVGPMDFIPVAERSNLIAKIDRWVLNAAAEQLAEWTDHPDFGDKPVAVNISGRHLGSGTLTDDVLEALRLHGVEPSRMLLEVTETSLLADLVTAARELTTLREAGVKVALDDFGTGYMSLSHLRTLPVDVLKIDQTFVAEMAENTDHPLVRLIIDTGHLLGVCVTAEGVETPLQADALTDMGVDSLQGYLFGRPAESEMIEPKSQANTTKA